MRAALIAGALVATVPGVSRAGPCEDAAAVAARVTDVPHALLLAIMQQESGGGPWVLNIAGRDVHPASPAEALALAAQAVKRGDNVDVGCFQVSTRYHAGGFASLAQMLSPLRNALYAALFLRDLRDQRGNWSEATACYHSCTPSRGAAYLAAVAARLQAR